MEIFTYEPKGVCSKRMTFMDNILRDIPTCFDTARLTLRCPQPGDGPEYHAAVLDSVDELRPWMRWAATTSTVDEDEARMRRAHIQFLERTDLCYLILQKGTDTLVGCTGLHYPDWSVPSFEIGYWVRTLYAGRGYITEAVIGLRDFAFEVLGARRLQIVCNALNARSAAVARRAGFEQEGILRCSARHHLTNELIDEYFFSIVRRDKGEYD
ncbi:MAG: GNAT family N-acetyltransferase [Chloroflexi bacterium]|nr:GNAT family N-acetyltransferase [Chloroflexota bacterium]